MAFTYKQFAAGGDSTTDSSTVTLSGVTAGSLIIVFCVIGLSAGTVSSVAVADGVPNSYSVTPNSPEKYGTGGDISYSAIAYFLASPSGTVTITATWTGGTVEFTQMDAYEFAYSGGTCAFDVDVAANNGTGTHASSPITIPSITPAAAGELLFGAWNTDAGDENGGNSPWVTPSGATAEAYILSSASGATAASFNDTVTPDVFTSQIAAWKIVASTNPRLLACLGAGN